MAADKNEGVQSAPVKTGNESHVKVPVVPDKDGKPAPADQTLEGGVIDGTTYKDMPDKPGATSIAQVQEVPERGEDA